MFSYSKYKLSAHSVHYCFGLPKATHQRYQTVVNFLFKLSIANIFKPWRVASKNHLSLLKSIPTYLSRWGLIQNSPVRAILLKLGKIVPRMLLAPAEADLQHTSLSLRYPMMSTFFLHFLGKYFRTSKSWLCSCCNIVSYSRHQFRTHLVYEAWEHQFKNIWDCLPESCLRKPCQLPPVPKDVNPWCWGKPNKDLPYRLLQAHYIYSYRLTGKNFSVPWKSRPQTQ